MKDEHSQGSEPVRKADFFWPTFLLVVGVVIGGNFSGHVRAVTYVAAEILLYRWWVVFIPLLLLVVAVGVIWYLERMEQARVAVELSQAKHDRIRAEVEDSLAAQVRHAERTMGMMSEQRQRLQKIMGNVFQESDRLQQDQVSFIYFVEQVGDLLRRRSKRLQDELPDNPVRVDKIRQRDENLQNELAEILQGIAAAFPDLAGSIPKPAPMAAPADKSAGIDHYEQIYLAKSHHDQTRYYKTRRVRKAAGSPKASHGRR